MQNPRHTCALKRTPNNSGEAGPHTNSAGRGARAWRPAQRGAEDRVRRIHEQHTRRGCQGPARSCSQNAEPCWPPCPLQLNSSNTVQGRKENMPSSSLQKNRHNKRTSPLFINSSEYGISVHANTKDSDAFMKPDLTMDATLNCI